MSDCIMTRHADSGCYSRRNACLSPTGPALDTLKLCDGRTTVKAISNQLSKEYEAPVSQILSDIVMMLQDLADKDFLRT